MVPKVKGGPNRRAVFLSSRTSSRSGAGNAEERYRAEQVGGSGSRVSFRAFFHWGVETSVGATVVGWWRRRRDGGQSKWGSAEDKSDGVKERRSEMRKQDWWEAESD